MTGRDFRRRAGRYSTVGFLAAIAAATTWYIAGEDANVGSDYSHIFHQDPSLIPANLTSLAALHIQTAAMVAQMCVTIGLALTFSRFPRRSSEQPDETVLALRALTEAVNRLGQLPATVPTDVLSPEAGDRKGGSGHPLRDRRSCVS